MYPKRAIKKISYGMQTKISSIGLMKYTELRLLTKMPRDIYATPKMTAIFILRELKKVS